MNNELKLTLRFDAENKQFIGQVRGADNAVAGLGQQSVATGRQINTLNRQSNMLAGQMLSLRNQLLAVAGGFSAVMAAQDATRTLAEYQDMRTQITALVGGQQQWLETEQYLIATATDHNKVLTDMAGNYARLASLQESGLLNLDEMRLIFEGMSNAQSQTGATSGQLEQSMYGLSQALASPIVRAEELNQVVEPLPGLLNKLDKAAGLQAGGFRQMMLAGEVTSDFFKETLISALEAYDGAAARTASNINARFAAVKNSYQQAVVAFEEPINDSLSPVLDTSAAALQGLADNAETVVEIVGYTLAVAMGRGAAAVGTMTAAKLADINASRQQAQAEMQTTRETLALTVAEIRRLETLQQTNAYIFTTTGGEKALAAERRKLTALTNQYTAVQTRANVAVRAGNAAFALAGGPTGVIMMAVGALVMWASSADTAAGSSKDLRIDIDELAKSYKDLTEKQRAAKGAELAIKIDADLAALDETRSEIDEIREELNNDTMIIRPHGSKEVIEMKRDLTDQQRQLNILLGKEEQIEQRIARQKALQKEMESYKPESKKPDGDGEPPVDPDAEKQASRMLENLKRQVALYGKTSEVAKVRYDIEHGALRNINDKLKEKLLLEAKDLDAKKSDKDIEKDNSAINAFYEESDQLNSAWMMRLAMQADMENQAKIQEQYAYEDRKAALSQSFQAAYAQASGNKQLQEELEREYFTNRELLHAEHQMNLGEIDKTATEQRKAYQQQVASELLTFTEQQLSITTNMLRQSGEEQSGLYKVLFAAQKMAAIPSMVVATEEAAAKALAAFPGPAGIAMSGTVRALGYTSVGIAAGQALAGQAHDGMWRVPESNEGTWMLKAGEMVLNPEQADSFRWMVTSMQQMQQMQAAVATAAYGSAAAGGMPVSINVMGVDKSQVTATARQRNGQLEIEMFINQAVEASLNAMYEDADNGGRISQRIRNQG